MESFQELNEPEANTKIIHAYVKPDIYKKMHEESKNTGLSVSSLLKIMINNYFERFGGA